MIIRMLLVAVLVWVGVVNAEEVVDRPVEDMDAILGGAAEPEKPRKKVIDIESLLKDDVSSLPVQAKEADPLSLGAQANKIIESTYLVAAERMLSEGGFKPFAYLMKGSKLFLVAVKQEVAKDFTQGQLVPVIKKLLKQYIEKGDWDAVVLYAYASVAMSDGRKKDGFVIELEFKSGASLNRFWQVSRRGEKGVDYGDFVDEPKETRYFFGAASLKE